MLWLRLIQVNKTVCVQVKGYTICEPIAKNGLFFGLDILNRLGYIAIKKKITKAVEKEEPQLKLIKS